MLCGVIPRAVQPDRTAAISPVFSGVSTVSPDVIYDERQRADDPCYRIAEDDRRYRGGYLHHHGQPDNAECADSGQGDDHWDDHIPHPAERAGQYLDDDIDDIPGDDQDEHITADPDHLRV